MERPSGTQSLGPWAHKVGVLRHRACVLKHTEPRSLDVQNYGFSYVVSATAKEELVENLAHKSQSYRRIQYYVIFQPTAQADRPAFLLFAEELVDAARCSLQVTVCITSRLAGGGRACGGGRRRGPGAHARWTALTLHNALNESTLADGPAHLLGTKPWSCFLCLCRKLHYPQVILPIFYFDTKFQIGSMIGSGIGIERGTDSRIENRTRIRIKSVTGIEIENDTEI
ncbi:hypothetical protein EVAR_59868_1 [Eumeta japonica]|uniref:Uncharacterized protein n=1 Tax=Eumeta variegata TaxID=151549 RepID=A0A4C1XNY9_EUMVA|nr:hypothetical protein EVAR_59868_1 [Eumeta japonica]